MADPAIKTIKESLRKFEKEICIPEITVCQAAPPKLREISIPLKSVCWIVSVKNQDRYNVIKYVLFLT